jgi:hypothetical protein
MLMQSNPENANSLPPFRLLMLIAIFDPGHLLIDLGQGCRSALLGAHNNVVRYQRYKFAIVVARLDLGSPMRLQAPFLSAHTLREY